MFFDTHCHLDDPQLSRDLSGVLAAARQVGISGFLVPGVHYRDWPRVLALAMDHPEVVPAFGLHPMHADLYSPEVHCELQRLTPFAAAIGEIGLDYALPSPSRQTQQTAFRSQLKVAVEAGLPVLIHCRKAFADLLVILRQEGVWRTGGVMHAFSGSPETARDCLDLGLHISLAGTVTYLNAVRPPAVAALVPLERLLLETDAPDLAPETHRGEVNLPEFMLETAARVARIKGITVEQLGEITTANALRLFRLETRAP